jgi:TolB protein
LEIAVVEVDSGQLRRITDSPGLDDYPAWSPAGTPTELAYTSNRDGNLEIYVCSADGGNARNASHDEAIDNFATWTPRGELTFVSNREGGFDVFVLRRQ